MANKFIKCGSGFLKYLLTCGQPFTAELTSTTAKIWHGEDRYLYTEAKLTPSQMLFIKRVKKEVDEDWEELNIPPSSAVKYYEFYQRLGRYEGVYEIDITAAYWRKAVEYGIIRPETAKRLSDMEFLAASEGADKLKKVKKLRLFALGALATTRYDIEFDGVTETVVNVHRRQTSDAFFYVASQVGKDMDRIASKNNALFYWVDAVFVLHKDLTQTIADFEALGYKVKSKEIQSVEFEPKKAVVKDSEGVRDFYLPTRTGSMRALIEKLDEKLI